MGIKSLLLLALAGMILVAALEASGPARAADWRSAPQVPRFDKGMRTRFVLDLKRSQKFHMRNSVFAKVGDSNTYASTQIFGLGCRSAKLHEYGELAPVIQRYRRVALPVAQVIPGCAPANSFSRRSVAARPFTDSLWATRTVKELRREEAAAGWKLVDDSCSEFETPITCEIRQIKPRYIFVQTGTNDRAYGFPNGRAAVRRFVQVVRHIRKSGSIPVLSTLPPMIPRNPEPTSVWSFVKEINVAIWLAGKRTRTPVINLWAAMTRPSMINFGIAPGDVAHLGVFGGEVANNPLANSVVFSRRALRYGVNRRNLLYLQTLRRMDALAADVNRRDQN